MFSSKNVSKINSECSSINPKEVVNNGNISFNEDKKHSPKNSNNKDINLKNDKHLLTAKESKTSETYINKDFCKKESIDLSIILGKENVNNISSLDNSFYPFSPIKITSENIVNFNNLNQFKEGKSEKLEHLRSSTEPNIINLTKLDNTTALSFNEEDSQEYINLIQEKDKINKIPDVIQTKRISKMKIENHPKNSCINLNAKPAMVNIAENENIWNYYKEKYLKYLFTGKSLNFKDSISKLDSIDENNIIGYSYNTNNGIARSYNEDRLICLTNILKPNDKICEYWPKVSFFGIFDGHGGSSVANWLSDNLCNYIIKQECFPQDPKQSILLGFAEAEEFINSELLSFYSEKNKKKNNNSNSNQKSKKKLEPSGSCAIIALIVNKICYIANTGDSRSLLSVNNMSRLYYLSVDHKPDDPIERKRIESNGGRIWKQKDNPIRVLPSGLSVRIFLK